MIKEVNVPTAVYLYDEGVEGVRVRQLGDFITEHFSRIRTHVIKLNKVVVATHGLLFDYIATQEAFNTAQYSNIKDACHVILTNKLVATLDERNRPHIRASIYSYPSLISLAGIVEGPAKPREYYVYKQKYAQCGIWEREAHRMRERFRGSFIDYGDARLTEVIKGYIAQALFFHITGDPFCPRKTCRLFNAHWQEDLIRAQITSGAFCSRHNKFLARLASKQ